MRELPYTWKLGRSQHSHAGFAVHKIIGRLNRPMERVGRIYESAEKAVDAAEGLGTGYAAFRVHRSKSGVEPLELIQRPDLPVTVSLNPQQRQ
jgi:hypothetical protein